MRLLRPVAVLVLPLSLLAACGGDDDDEGADTGGADATASSSESDARTDPELEADQALADGIVLTIEEVGPGWTVAEEEDEADDEDDELLDDEVAECLDIDPDDFPEETDDPEANASFEQEAASIEASVTVAAADADLDLVFDVFEAEGFADCYEKLLQDEMRAQEEEGLEFTGVEVTELALPQEIGGQGIALRAVVSAEAEGIDFDTFSDIYFVQRGRVGISLITANAFEPLDEQYTLDLLALMVERAPAPA